MKCIGTYEINTFLKSNFIEEMDQTLILSEETFLQGVPMRKSGQNLPLKIA